MNRNMDNPKDNVGTIYDFNGIVVALFKEANRQVTKSSVFLKGRLRFWM